MNEIKKIYDTISGTNIVLIPKLYIFASTKENFHKGFFEIRHLEISFISL